MSTFKTNCNCAGFRPYASLALIIPMFILLSLKLSAFGQSVPENKFTVVLDAGHGGKDPGAISGHTYEKHIVLAITKKLGKYIEDLLPDVTVIYTRNSDVFVELYERAEIANRNQADVFISIHADSWNTSSPYGTSTYVMGIAKNESNLQLVMKENAAMKFEDDYENKYQIFMDPTSVEFKIVSSVMQNTYQKQSLSLAAEVQDQFRERAMRRDRGVNAGQLIVLHKTTMPSILIETGFISNPTEQKYLLSSYGQDIIASSIFRAFKKYKEEIQQKTINAKANTAVENSPVEAQNSNSVKVAENNSKNLKIIPIEENRTIKDELKDSNNTFSAKGYDFRIQVMSTSKPLSMDHQDLKGYKELEQFELDGRYKYMTKAVKSYEEALTQRKQIIKLFPSAFIVAFHNGQPVELLKAIDATKQ